MGCHCLLFSKYPQRTEIRYSVKYLQISVRIGTIYNWLKVEATQVSIKRWIDKQNVVSTYTGILSSQSKEWNSLTCYNMSEPSGHDSKLTKQAIKGQIFYDSTYMRNRSIETWSRIEVTGGWGTEVRGAIIYWMQSFSLGWWKSVNGYLWRWQNMVSGLNWTQKWLKLWNLSYIYFTIKNCKKKKKYTIGLSEFQNMDLHGTFHGHSGCYRFISWPGVNKFTQPAAHSGYQPTKILNNPLR